MPVSTFTAVQDVYIASAYPDQNFDNRSQGNTLYAGTFIGGTSDIYRSLLQFNLFESTKGIPPNCTIESADLTISMFRNDNVGTAQVSIFRLLDFFNQSTVTFNTQPPSDTTAFGPVTPPSRNSILNINILSLVQGWYDGSIPNNGIVLKGLENANDNILGFFSTRSPLSDFWPALRIKWSKGTLSEPITDILSGAPSFSTFVDMAGKEQATWLIFNPTATALAGVVQVLQGTLLIDYPGSAFTVPAVGSQVVFFTGAVDSARLKITTAGADTYTISVETRDE